MFTANHLRLITVFPVLTWRRKLCGCFGQLLNRDRIVAIQLETWTKRCVHTPQLRGVQGSEGTTAHDDGNDKNTARWPRVWLSLSRRFERSRWSFFSPVRGGRKWIWPAVRRTACKLRGRARSARSNQAPRGSGNTSRRRRIVLSARNGRSAKTTPGNLPGFSTKHPHVKEVRHNGGLLFDLLRILLST